MMSSDFSTSTHGKWILAGEHAVLRGSTAVVCPIPGKNLQLLFHPTQGDCKAEFTGDFSEDAHLLFWSVLEQGLEWVGQSLAEVSGKFNLHNDIAMGAGMGASAALCAALSRWFAWKEYIRENEIFQFAKQLEDLFHGQSSGVDIAGALTEIPLIYHANGEQQPLKFAWQPHLYLSYSDQVGVTSHCVKKVKELMARDPVLGERIDLAMHASVELAIAALQKNASDGLAELTTAINQAHICFRQWGLAGGKVEQHINQLLEAGALATKPTGSGDGGYVLSLWASPPDHRISQNMLRC